MIGKLEQMANTADSSVHDEANPCGHPAGRPLDAINFAYRKLHLATFISVYNPKYIYPLKIWKLCTMLEYNILMIQKHNMIVTMKLFQENSLNSL